MLVRAYSGRFLAMAPWVRYGSALVTTVVAVVIRRTLDSEFGAGLPFIVFYPAVAVSGWLGGFGPGVVTTVLCAAVADYYWMEPVRSLMVAHPGDQLALFIFVVTSVGISALNEAWRRAAATIIRSDEKFRLAVEAAPGAMILVDSTGTIRQVNAQTHRLLGYSEGEIVGRSIEQLVPERFRSNHAEYRSGFLRDSRQRPMGSGRDLYALRKDGSEVPVEIGLSPLQTPEGPLVLAAITDITERKHTAALLQGAFEAERAAKREAQQAIKVKDELLYTLSHELREPVDALLHWSHVLRMRSDDEDVRSEAVDAVIANVARQEQLLDDLVDVTRKAAGVRVARNVVVEEPATVNVKSDPRTND